MTDKKRNHEEYPGTILLWTGAIFSIFGLALLVAWSFGPTPSRAHTGMVLQNWGMVIDISGFVLLWSEWSIALYDPELLKRRIDRRVNKELAWFRHYKERIGEDAAALPTVINSRFGTQDANSVNEDIAALERKLALLAQEPATAIALKSRKHRFNIGGSLIVAGFILQLGGNWVAGPGA